LIVEQGFDTKAFFQPAPRRFDLIGDKVQVVQVGHGSQAGMEFQRSGQSNEQNRENSHSHSFVQG